MSSKTMPLVPSLWLVLFVLAAVLLLALSGDAFSPFVRTLFALPLMAFLPGYAFLRAFVAADKLTRAQRYTLSVGFSLVLTIFVGFGLDRLPWGLTTQTWAISLGAVVLACLAVEGLRSQHGAKEPPTNALSDTPSAPSRSPIILQASLLMVAAAIVGLAFLMARNDALNLPTPSTLQLWMLPESPAVVRIGINTEAMPEAHYRVQLMRDGRVLREWAPVLLRTNQAWQTDVRLEGDLAQAGKLEVLLFKLDDSANNDVAPASASAIRRTALWVKP